MDSLAPVGAPTGGGSIYGQIHDPSMDMGHHEAMDFDHSMEPSMGHPNVPTGPQGQAQPWYDTDL